MLALHAGQKSAPHHADTLLHAARLLTHQLMHACVLAAALLNGYAMERLRELRLTVAPCGGGGGESILAHPS